MYKKMIKRRIVSIVAAMVFLLALSGCGAAENEGSVYMNINAEKAKEMMDGLEKFVLLDARSEEEFLEGHIPGAIVIPHEEVSERAEALGRSFLGP